MGCLMFLNGTVLYSDCDQNVYPTVVGCCSRCFASSFCLFRKQLRKGKSVSGGKDLGLSASYTASFASAVFEAWFKAWVFR